jgi:hypothetical protein
LSGRGIDFGRDIEEMTELDGCKRSLLLPVHKFIPSKAETAIVTARLPIQLERNSTTDPDIRHEARLCFANLEKKQKI